MNMRTRGMSPRTSSRRTERLVCAGARREALDADARVDQLMRRSQPRRGQIPERRSSGAVGRPEAITMLERAGIPREAGPGEEGGLDAAAGGVADVERLAVRAEVG